MKGLLGTALALAVGWVVAAEAPEGAVATSTVHLAVSVAGEAPPPVRGSLIWTSSSGEQGARVEIEGAGTYPISIPPGIGILSASVPGFWMAETVLGPGREQVGVLLVPTGRLEGEVRTPAGSAEPEALDLELGPASFLQSLAPNPAASLEGSVDCPVQDGRFRCDVPEGSHDLRWHAEGFASVLRWNVDVAAGSELEVEPLELIPGGALLGFVELSEAVPAPDPEGPDRSVVVGLSLAAGVARDHDNHRRLTYLDQEVEIGPDGSFQFTGLAPGRYRLSVASPGLAAGSEPVVEVFEGRESRLSTPILLEPLLDQEIRLSPPHSPQGKPWRVHLLGVDGRSAEGFCTSGPSGDCRIHDLPAGEYRLLVEDAPSSRVHTRPGVVVSSQAGPLVVELPLVLIEGEITRAGDPARARIILSRRTSGERLETYSDYDGRFSGFVPEEGPWEVAAAMEARGVEVGLGTYEVSRPADGSPFELNLELADTTLVGTVLTHLGQPEPRATVQVYSDRGQPVSRGRTDREGTFRVWGLPEGTHRVRARASQRVARSAPFELEEDRVTRVEIRLPGVREVTGRIVAEGRPLTGSTVVVAPEIPGEIVQTEAISGLDGTFRARVAEGVSRVNLLILPPGLAVRLVSAALDGDPVQVSVDRWGGTLELHDAEGLAFGHSLQQGPASILIGPLMRWAQLFGHSRRPGDPTLQLPQMGPGAYRLCSPDGQRCAEGELAAGGRLVLSLPRATSAE